MNDSHLENCLFDLLCPHLSLRRSEIRRLAALCSAGLLARNCHMSEVGKWLNRAGKPESKVRYVRRNLESPFFESRSIYMPLVQEALRAYSAPRWHLIIDRTNLVPKVKDLLMVSLAYRKRGIPLAWSIGDFGPTNYQEQIALLETVKPLLPSRCQIILHGDAEFGSVKLMNYIRQQPLWEFILGQRSRTKFRSGNGQWRAFHTVSVSRRKAFYQDNVCWSKSYQWGPVNIFAFWAPYQTGPSEPQIKVRYFTTSLLIGHTLRQLGRRRWGTEPMFRDYKSAGFSIHHSRLKDNQSLNTLLSILAINYLFATATGVWLCKSGRRSEIDSKKKTVQLFPHWP